MKQTLVHKTLHFKQTGVDEVNHIIRGVFSTPAEDRQGEIVDQKSWILDEFIANPVILFAHDHSQPAVAKCVELVNDVTKGLTGAIQFAYDEYDFAATLFKLYAGGYMRAFSVGFMNGVYEVDQDTDMVTLRENTLYEISCVNVPANAMALAYSKGIDTSAIERVQTKKKEVEPEEKPAEIPAEVPVIEEPAETLVESEHADISSDADKASDSNIHTIVRAIASLQRVVEARGADNKGGVGRTLHGNVDGKRIPKALVNRAIKDLMKVKHA